MEAPSRTTALALPPGLLTLNGRAQGVLHTAVRNGFITVEDVSGLLPERLAKNPRELNDTIAWLIGFFRTVGVTITTVPLSVSGMPIAGDGEGEEERKRTYLEKLVDDVHSEGGRRGEEFRLLNAYLKEMRRFRVLPHEEIWQLAQRRREENALEARNTIVAHNLRLALMTARRYRGKVKDQLGGGLDYLDLIQEGNIGLMRAAEKFDERRGFHFGTYALYWTRQAITRAIQDDGQLIRVPVSAQLELGKIMGVSGRLVDRLGREPTIAEIATEAGMAVEMVEKILRQRRVTTISLDDLMDPEAEEGPSRHEVTQGNELNPEDIFGAKEELREALARVNELLARLFYVKGRDTEIFRLRYGLDGSFEPKTLEVIGAQHGVTRERIRQIVEAVWTELEAQGVECDEEQLGQELDRIQFLAELVGSGVRFEAAPQREVEAAGRHVVHHRRWDTREAVPDVELNPDQVLQAEKELQQACHRLRLILGVAKFSSLQERDIQIFMARYGLEGSFQVKTLEAVAERYKLTRERIRQIVDDEVWPKLRELGVKQDDEWLREELRRIRLLENLAGEAAKL